MEKENKGRNLGELIEHLEGVAAQGSKEMDVTFENVRVNDFNTFIETNSENTAVNISSQICCVTIEQTEIEPTMMAMAFDALNICVLDFGWQIVSLVINEAVAKVAILEEGEVIEKEYHAESDTWE